MRPCSASRRIRFPFYFGNAYTMFRIAEFEFSITLFTSAMRTIGVVLPNLFFCLHYISFHYKIVNTTLQREVESMNIIVLLDLVYCFHFLRAIWFWYCKYTASVRESLSSMCVSSASYGTCLRNSSDLITTQNILLIDMMTQWIHSATVCSPWTARNIRPARTLAYRRSFG